MNADIFSLMFYPKRAHRIPQVMCFSSPAMLDHQGTIHLKYRLSANIGNSSAIIIICVDGKSICFDKYKYPEVKKSV